MFATIGQDGPNISPKGSMIVLDDGHLAYWERFKSMALDNFKANPNVAVMYSNKACAERGEFRDKFRTMLQGREINHDGAKERFSVVIKLERTENMRG